MNRNNIDIRLLIKGRPITEYFHNGSHFVEGRDGSNFEIELVNQNPFRIEAIVSVDGLSVTDGKEASDRSTGYLIEANQTLRIPGWKLDSAQVASFVFAGKSQGYAAQSTGSAANSGVIGVLAYREKVQTYVNNGFRHQTAFPGGISKGVMRSMHSPSYGGSNATLNNVTLSSSMGMAVGSVATGGGYVPTSCTADASLLGKTVQTSFSPEVAQASAATLTVNNLGTGFGEATDFATTQVSFERGDMLCMAVVYYDNSRGLKARGIEITRPSRVRYNSQPQAFPGMHQGCVPPVGWTR